MGEGSRVRSYLFRVCAPFVSSVRSPVRFEAELLRCTNNLAVQHSHHHELHVNINHISHRQQHFRYADNLDRHFQHRHFVTVTTTTATGGWVAVAYPQVPDWVLWIFAIFVAVLVLPVCIVSFRYHLYREVVVPVTIQERLPSKARQANTRSLQLQIARAPASEQPVPFGPIARLSVRTMASMRVHERLPQRPGVSLVRSTPCPRLVPEFSAGAVQSCSRRVLRCPASLAVTLRPKTLERQGCHSATRERAICRRMTLPGSSPAASGKTATGAHLAARAHCGFAEQTPCAAGSRVTRVACGNACENASAEGLRRRDLQHDDKKHLPTESRPSVPRAEARLVHELHGDRMHRKSSISDRATTALGSYESARKLKWKRDVQTTLTCEQLRTTLGLRTRESERVTAVSERGADGGRAASAGVGRGWLLPFADVECLDFLWCPEEEEEALERACTEENTRLEEERQRQEVPYKTALPLMIVGICWQTFAKLHLWQEQAKAEEEQAKAEEEILWRRQEQTIAHQDLRRELTRLQRQGCPSCRQPELWFPKRNYQEVGLPERQRVAWDSDGGYLDEYSVLAGGWNGANWLSDPWSYEVPYKEWQQLNISPAPMARSQHVAVWDKAGQRVWLHGGYGTGLFGDLWTLGRGRSSVWAEVTFAGGLVHLRRLQRDPLRRPFGISGDHYLDYTLQDKFFNSLDLQLHHHKLQLHSLPDKYFTHTVVKYHRKHQLKQPFHQHQQQLHDVKLEHHMQQQYRALRVPRRVLPLQAAVLLQAASLALQHPAPPPPRVSLQHQAHLARPQHFRYADNLDRHFQHTLFNHDKFGSSWVLWIFAIFVAVFVLPVSIVSFRCHLYREVVVPVTIQERLPFRAPQPVDPPRLCMTSWVLLTLPVLSITSPPPPVAVHSGAARISIRLRSDMRRVLRCPDSLAVTLRPKTLERLEPRSKRQDSDGCPISPPVHTAALPSRLRLRLVPESPEWPVATRLRRRDLQHDDKKHLPTESRPSVPRAEARLVHEIASQSLQAASNAMPRAGEKRGDFAMTGVLAPLSASAAGATKLPKTMKASTHEGNKESADANTRVQMVLPVSVRFKLSRQVTKLLELARSGDLEAFKAIAEAGEEWRGVEGPQAIPSSEAGVLVPDRSKTFINCSDIRRRTALMYASAIGSRDVAGVEYLLSQVDVNAMDDMLKTALHHAALHSKAEISRLLLRAGAMIDARDHNGCTACSQAEPEKMKMQGPDSKTARTQDLSVWNCRAALRAELRR
ncbi:unnamed protein product [Symbiodinium sp. KB8]|nr:unnamed protein product [Symbiodinium sp. KB8]